MNSRSLRWLRRISPNWRFTFVSVTLVATTAVTMIAAYQLHASLRDHDEAVERVLADYARYTSRTFGEALLRHGIGTFMEVMAPPTMIPAEGPGRGLSLADFAEHASRSLRSHGFEDDPRSGFFRFDPATGGLQGIGALTRAPLADSAAAIVRARLEREDLAEDDNVVRFDFDGEPLSLTFKMQRTRAGDPVFAFGIVLSRRYMAAAQTRWVMDNVPLFPQVEQLEHTLPLPTERRRDRVPPPAPPLISSAPLGGEPLRNDSLVSIELFDHQGRLLFRTPQQYDSSVQGEFAFRTRPGGVAIRATLSPRVVEQIRALHRPDRSRHYAVLLPFISIILGTSALIHLLRERELVRTRRNFVASVSHELRTPLAQIQIMAETLLRGRERSEEERQRWLAVIGREAYRMGGLVENILMFSHLERDQLRLAREPIDLAELVLDVLDTFGPLAATRRAQICAEIPDGIVVDIDPRAVRQVLGNLLDNALKYGPAGQTVRVAAMPAGEGQVLVSVADQGPGVPPEERKTIWQPFRRLDHRDGSAGGSGLGLAVVSSVVAHHGGAFFVDEAPGGGARFVITLPLVPPHPETPHPAAPLPSTFVEQS